VTLEKIVHNWHVKVICIVISMVLVFFTRANSLKVESVILFLNAKTNNNYTFTQSLPSRVTVFLKGEESEIKKIVIDDLFVYIDASKITKKGVYTLPILIDQDKILGQTSSVEITVSPLSITMHLEEKITKYLSVYSVITGIPSHGHEISSWFINPAVISVAGPVSHLQDLQGIYTEPIDVTGKNQDFTSRVRINRDDKLLSFPEGEFVEFKGEIQETSAVKVIDNVNIAAKGLVDSLEIVGELPQISVNVEGKLLSLEDFSKTNIALSINLDFIDEPGEYEVPITYWTPRYAHVFNKSKDSIKITVDTKIKPGVQK